MGYLYIVLTILLSAYGQVIIKWRLNTMPALPDGFLDKILFLLSAIIDPFILSGFVAAFLASLTWMAALTKFQLSFAYPFMSLSFLVVFLLSVFFLNEPFTTKKMIGLALIIVGLIISSS